MFLMGMCVDFLFPKPAFIKCESRGNKLEKENEANHCTRKLQVLCLSRVGGRVLQHDYCLSQHSTFTICHVAGMVNIRAIYLGQSVWLKLIKMQI